MTSSMPPQKPDPKPEGAAAPKKTRGSSRRVTALAITAGILVVLGTLAVGPHGEAAARNEHHPGLVAVALR